MLLTVRYMLFSLFIKVIALAFIYSAVVMSINKIQKKMSFVPLRILNVFPKGRNILRDTRAT